MIHYMRSMFKTNVQTMPNSSLLLKAASTKSLAHSLPFDILEEIFLFVPYKYCQNIWIASSILHIPLAPKLKRLREYQEWLLEKINQLEEKLKANDEAHKKEIGEWNEKLKANDEAHKKDIAELNEKLKDIDEKLKATEEKLKTTDEKPKVNVVSNLDAEPVSEEYEEKRQEALQMSPMQLRKMSEKEREEYVFQYLTPDEIWVLKDAIKKIPPVSKIELPPKTQDSDGLHNIASGFTEHDQKRREFLQLCCNFRFRNLSFTTNTCHLMRLWSRAND